MNQVPGSEVVGCGFNILGQYDVSSVMGQIFRPSASSETWTYPPTSVTYSVPANQQVVSDTNTVGNATVFSSREKVLTYFAAKAGVKVSYMGFSGEMNASFSTSRQTDQSCYFGLYEAEYSGWRVLLQQQDSSGMSPEFAAALGGLPASCNTSNQDQFFQFFRRFGTHVVTQVQVGGALRYGLTINKSYSMDETKVQANVALEYKAVMVDAAATASVDWSNLGEDWASSRTVIINSVGADTGPLDALQPSYGENDNAIFSAWNSAVMSNPAVINFVLQPLSSLVSGAQASALDEALNDYTNGVLYLNANVDMAASRQPVSAFGILLKGVVLQPSDAPLPPAPADGYPLGGFQIALIDPATQAVLFNKLYYVQDPLNPQNVYPGIVSDLSAVTAPDYIAAVTGFGVPMCQGFPSPAFAEWLIGCGAALSGWRQYMNFCGDPGVCNYLLVGRRGTESGEASEIFCSITDTWQGNFTPIDNELVYYLYGSQASAARA